MTNGEKYKTLQERAEAFDKYCDERCCLDQSCSVAGRRKCLLDWLDIECEEEKPLPCPFCGGECKTFELLLEKEHYVVCDKCRYTSAKASTDYEAIAAHNHVAKKCMEVKE